MGLAVERDLPQPTDFNLSGPSCRRKNGRHHRDGWDTGEGLLSLGNCTRSRRPNLRDHGDRVIRVDDMNGVGVTVLEGRGGGARQFHSPSRDCRRLEVHLPHRAGRTLHMDALTGAGWMTLRAPGIT